MQNKDSKGAVIFTAMGWSVVVMFIAALAILVPIVVFLLDRIVRLAVWASDKKTKMTHVLLALILLTAGLICTMNLSAC